MVITYNGDAGQRDASMTFVRGPKIAFVQNNCPRPGEVVGRSRVQLQAQAGTAVL